MGAPCDAEDVPSGQAPPGKRPEAFRTHEGSCGIDEMLLVSGIQEFQYIEIHNVISGERFATYVIRAPRGTGSIRLNGAVARNAGTC